MGAVLNPLEPQSFILDIYARVAAHVYACVSLNIGCFLLIVDQNIRLHPFGHVFYGWMWILKVGGIRPSFRQELFHVVCDWGRIKFMLLIFLAMLLVPRHQMASSRHIPPHWAREGGLAGRMSWRNKRSVTELITNRPTVHCSLQWGNMVKQVSLGEGRS